MSSSSEKTQISSRLLLVEGVDEVNFFHELTAHFDLKKKGLTISDVGGKDKFKRKFEALRNKAKFASPELIGIVRDADENAKGSFQSICDALKDTGFTPPSRHGEFSTCAVPYVGVFIIPDGLNKGALETLCRQAQDDAAAQCAEEYIKCLKDKQAVQSPNEDKSFAHAYLAAMKNPVARVGEGAKQKVWNFDAPAFSALTQFLSDLVCKSVEFPSSL